MSDIGLVSYFAEVINNVYSNFLKFCFLDLLILIYVGIILTSSTCSIQVSCLLSFYLNSVNQNLIIKHIKWTLQLVFHSRVSCFLFDIHDQVILAIYEGMKDVEIK